jgi:radical SAM-linked protein
MNLPRNRLRVRFAKTAEMRLLGHRDLIRLYERALRRTGLVLKLSEGFHPKARLSFPLALATGMEGAQEVMEVEFDDPISPEQLQRLLQPELPAGIALQSVTLPPPFSKKARVLRVTYRMPIPFELHAQARQRIADFYAQNPFWITRPGRIDPIDGHAHLQSFSVRGDSLEIVQEATQSAIAGPRDLLRAIDMSFLEEQGAWWTRCSVELENEADSETPDSHRPIGQLAHHSDDDCDGPRP